MQAETEKKPPLISVITVVRNAEDQITGCLASVAAQTGVAYEHWVVDGDSTDRTVAILKASTDPRVRWISEPDAGVYDAMNKAVRKAAGDWILFLGADDRLRAGALRDMAVRLVDPRTIYYGDVWMTCSHRRYAGRFSRFRLARRNICQQAIFYPRTVFDTHTFDTTYRIVADWVLNMACRADARFRFEYVPRVVADYNDRTGTSSIQRDQAMERDYLQLLQRYFPPVIARPWSVVVRVGRAVKRRLGLRAPVAEEA